MARNEERDSLVSPVQEQYIGAMIVRLSDSLLGDNKLGDLADCLRIRTKIRSPRAEGYVALER